MRKLVGGEAGTEAAEALAEEDEASSVEASERP